jgi:hypothetical protein
MLPSHHQSTRENDDINVANRSFENVAQFKYLGMPVTTQNFIQEEIKRRMNLGNLSHQSVHNLLFSHVLSKSLKIML